MGKLQTNNGCEIIYTAFNNAKFKRVDEITQEIKEEAKYHLNNDGLILM